jgi:CRP-like cAMP-binding protein
MFDTFLQYVADYSSLKLSDEEIEVIKQSFKLKKLRKRQYLLQEGDTSKYISFVIKGALRQYTVDDKGHEHIVRFGIERWWMGDYEGFMMKTPSRYNIDAIDDSELLQISYEQLEDLKKTVPAIEAMLKKIDQRSYISQQRRIHSSISNTAEDRYIELLNTYPEFLQRFPQNMIASYLGISPETLSRIRKQMAGK